MNVLVTGGAGYIGSVLREKLLQEGHSVTVLDNLMYGPANLFHLCANPDFSFVLGDARDAHIVHKLVRKADVVVPLAAIVGAPACAEQSYLAQTVNVNAVRAINAFRSKGQLLILPNTNSGYGAQTDIICTEDTPMAPLSLYGRTKLEAEKIVLDSENTIVLRLATVFGMSPRMRLDLLVNDFVYKAVTDGYITVFESHFQRNYIHVRDVADCFVHCIDSRDAMCGLPYNVGLDDANLSKAELVQEIQAQVPGFYAHFSEIGADPDQRNYVVSNQRLREAGWEAKRSLATGIEELLKGYRMMGRGQFNNV